MKMKLMTKIIFAAKTLLQGTCAPNYGRFPSRVRRSYVPVTCNVHSTKVLSDTLCISAGYF